MTVPLPPRLIDGVRVIDLIWIGAGATRFLASLETEVICIEPTDPYRIDLARYVPPSRILPGLRRTLTACPTPFRPQTGQCRVKTPDTQAP